MLRKRGLLSIKDIKKLAKTDQPLFLAVVRHLGSPKRMKNKIACVLGASRAQGMTEGTKCAKLKMQGPKKDF